MTSIHIAIPAIYNRKSEGFSLIEMMIVLVIGLVLVSGMITVFSATNKSSMLNRAVATIQEDARFALETISKDIRLVGFQGCVTTDESNVVVNAVNAPISDYSQGIKNSAIWLSEVASATSWLPQLPLGSAFTPPASNPAVTGTQVLALQFGGPAVYPLNAPVGITNPAPSGLIEIAGNPLDININTGDLAIISDCQGGDLFYVTDTTNVGTTAKRIAHTIGTGTNSVSEFSSAYGSTTALRRQARVMRFNSNIYYIGDTGLDNQRGDDITALYLQTYPYSTNNPPIELVQGADQLAVSFTQLDESGNALEINAGDTAIDPSKIQAVRIGILLSSYDLVADSNDTKTYIIAGQPVVPATSVTTSETTSETTSAAANALTHPGDRRLRLAFNTTVKVRNMRSQE